MLLTSCATTGANSSDTVSVSALPSEAPLTGNVTRLDDALGDASRVASPDSVTDVASPFSTVVELDVADIAMDSVRRLHDDVLVMNTASAGSLLVEVRAGQTPVVQTISELGQVACVSTLDEPKSRIAIVERDAKKATFKLMIWSFDGVDVAHAEQYHTKTRGYMPDPGSGCAFLGPKQLVTKGTRLRDDRTPYYGVFTIDPRQLEWWSAFGEHVPDIVDSWFEKDEPFVTMALVVREDGQAPRQQDALFAVRGCDVAAADAVMGCQRGVADHLVHAPSGVLAVSNDGLCVAKLGETPVCLADGEKVRRFHVVDATSADVLFESGRHVLVTSLDQSPEFTELPKNEVVLLKLDAQRYLIADQLDWRLNHVRQLRVAQMRTGSNE